jgi:hypothetical protein
MLAQSFEEFINSMQLDNTEDIETKFKNITKRLNTSYYNNNSDEEHGYMVGSVGRHTAIKGVSDLDMLFVLPDELYSQYDGDDTNGQKELLKAVKKELQKRYPNSELRGDGQVVVISFTNYVVEVCPAFEESDGSYTYPDSNNGGKWKRTDPLVEIGESEYMIEHTNNHFKYVCQIIRAWKNHMGFKMGGLLVDTLVHKFFNKHPVYETTTFDDYLFLLKDLFNYFKGLNKDQKYWFALGSNQRVYNKSSKFITKAEEAYEKLKDLDEDSEDVFDKLQELFGKSFPIPETVTKSEQASYAIYSVSDREQFIHRMFPVDIKFNLSIDCEVKQNGFRETLLRILLREKKPLLPNKNLTFFITENEVEDKGLSFDIYWKVRNRGEEAIKRNKLRGEIIKGTSRKVEETQFKGGHYVECYIIHNGVCVARDRIDVPISNFSFRF